MNTSMKNCFNQTRRVGTVAVLAVLAVLLVACKSKNEPKQYAGSIIGTIGCYDEETRSVFYKGYYIETNTKDTFLSFDLDVKDSIDVPYGTRAISAIPIPYSFLATVLKTDDDRYVRYAPIIQDAMFQPIVVHDEKQVIITPTN